MSLLEAARQALPGIAWEQVSSNGVEYVYGKGSKGSYGAFELADIAKFIVELTVERDALDDDLGETPRAALVAEVERLTTALDVARTAAKRWYASEHDELCYSQWPGDNKPDGGECNCGSDDNNAGRALILRALGVTNG